MNFKAKAGSKSLANWEVLRANLQINLLLSTLVKDSPGNYF